MISLYTSLASLCLLFFPVKPCPTILPALHSSCVRVVCTPPDGTGMFAANNGHTDVQTVGEYFNADSSDIHGNISRPDCGNPVPDAIVDLTGDTTLSDSSDASGNYEFLDLERNKTYLLKPSKDGGDRDGITVLDMLAISRHILGLEPFSSPYKVIEADVNKSTSVTTFDVVEIKKLILGTSEEFPANTSWRFVPKDFVFTNPFNPFIPPFPEDDLYDPLLNDEISNFYGLKTGDVAGCGVPNGPATVKFLASDETISACGDWVDISVEDFDGVFGFQFSMDWDTSLMAYEAWEFPVGGAALTGLETNSIGTAKVAMGKLTIAWTKSFPNVTGESLPDGTVLFRIKFRPVSNFTGTGTLAFTDLPTVRQVVYADLKPYNMLQDNGMLDIVPLILNTTKVNVLCHSGSNGAIDLIASGGVGPYAYLWSGGETTQGISGISAGTYTVSVTDFNTCTKTLSATITEPSEIALEETQVNVLCHGGSNGAIDLSASGGVGPYTYLWSGGETTQGISGLGAGTYTVIVTDFNTCTKTLFATITEPADMVLEETQVNVLCHGGSNGAIDLIASGGVGPYTYLWSGGETTQGISGLGAGTYTVSVTDFNACTKTLSATISEPADMVLEETQVNVLCHGGSNGSIDLSASGGVGPYTYLWSGGETTQGISGLGAGTYTVIVTDFNTCTKTLSATITEPSEIALEETQVNVLCHGGSNGSIDLSASGGVGPYTYLWSGGETTQGISGLGAGTYTVSVTGFNACTKTLSATITEPADMVLEETQVNVLCHGGSNGSIDLSASGGVGPYTYLWSGGETTQGISGLAAGIYSVIVTDFNACTKTLSATITEPADMVLEETQVNVLCHGGSNGSIDLSASGGVGPYTYLWSGGETTQGISGLGAGTYTVIVTDFNTCTKTLFATITEPADMVLEETQVNVLCHGGSNGSIDLSASGGVGPYTYLWSGGETTQGISGLAAGTYTVSVTDFNTCTKPFATITEPADMVLEETQVNVLCHGGSNGSIDLSASGGVGPYTYLWSGGETTQGISALAAGTYTVSVTDFNSCTKTLAATISEPSALALSTVVTPANPGVNNGTIDLTVSGGIPAYTYLWTSGSTVQDLVNLDAGTYTVTVTDNNGCEEVVEVVVDLMVGTKEVEGQAFLVYPNPAADWVKVVLPEQAEACRIELMDSAGRIVRFVSLPAAPSFAGATYCQLDLKGLPSGTYILVVKQNEQAGFYKSPLGKVVTLF